MKYKVVAGIMLSLLLIGMLALAFNIQQVKASGTIYIRADGSVEPSTANITSVDNITYTFTNNINDYIVVQRNNIKVDGAGYTLRGTGSGTGMNLSYRNNVTLKNVEVTNFNHGIFLGSSSNNTVTGNTASDNTFGIFLYSSSNNTVSGNNLSSNNYNGIVLLWSSNNVFFHNNLIGNPPQASVTTGYVNTWDNGYPSGGNYWSDHNPPDVYSGPYQNVTGSDGIGDTPYVIDADNQDNYPLMGPFTEFSVYLEDVTYHVDVVSNSTLSDFNFNQPDKLINFNVTGPDDTLGFCRVTIPKILLGGPYTVLVDNLPPTTLTETSNGIHTFLYFTYSHTTKNVKIIGTRVGPIVGDINSDGIVGISDVVIAALCFGSTVAEPNIVGYPYDPRADLNNDGIIDICDLVIIGVNFGKTV